MDGFNQHELARRLMDLTLVLDKFNTRKRTKTRLIANNAYIVLDPTSLSPLPSENSNQVHFWGLASPATSSDLPEIIERYRIKEIPRYFLMLTPTANTGEQLEWLQDNGILPYMDTTYHALFRVTDPSIYSDTSLNVRRLDPGEIAEHDDSIRRVFEGPFGGHAFRGTAGNENAFHFAAFNGPRLVAASLLFIHNGLGYLCDASTLAPYRNMGAQSAMIAARIRHAYELGCDMVCSETLGYLKTSSANLHRLGFSFIFERKAFLWENKPVESTA